MSKEEKEYVLTALHFALDKGNFVDEDIETAYNSLNNSITVIEKEFVSEGWIKINSEDDLPKEDCNCWIVVDGDIERDYFNGYDFDDYVLEFITHYQKIIKPEPPLY